MKNLKPITREETMLAKAAGQDVPTLEPVTREEYFLADVIEAIESGGGGGGLPAVTSGDNGDVLTVVEGAWAKATPSGGGTMYVNLHYEVVEGEPVFSMDKTVVEIAGAVESGSTVILKANREGDTISFYNLKDCKYQAEANDNIARFVYWEIISNTLNEETFELRADGSVYLGNASITGTGE